MTCASSAMRPPPRARARAPGLRSRISGQAAALGRQVVTAEEVHVLLPEDLFGVEQIMGSAPEPESLGRGWPSQRLRPHVIELELPAAAAARPVGCREG